jgi:isocitrate dehydrogenase kinase/phosphatase
MLQAETSADTDVARLTANAILDAFIGYHAEFKKITRWAKQRFEQQQWHELHEDTQQRLDLYKDSVGKAVNDAEDRLGARTQNKEFWIAVKDHYTRFIEQRDDFDIAQSFYNSVVMRVVPAPGLDPDVHYVGSELDPPPPYTGERVFKTYPKRDTTRALIHEMLLECGFACPFENLEESVAHVAEMIDASLQQDAEGSRTERIERVEMAEPVFYRGKGAYLVGRVCTNLRCIPLVIALLNNERGIHIDAVLLTEDEVSIIFSFARSYFHVEVAKPRALVRFLKAIMPLKPIAELYISLGYNKHGKTELYRNLMRHLEQATDKFEIARGERGMVMVVFTLPSYDVVFKIIKDRFDYPKTTTRQEVRNRYYLVFKHDRGGRLVDAQEFEHLRFDKAQFSLALLEELLRVAPSTVSLDGDQVEINHLYTERRLVPLNLYLQEADEERAIEAVIDYGQTIKDLAATNIFPGDILLKNFGVTRHGRVVFYDYDELCLLTDCTFRRMPEPTDPFEDIAPEPWFSVAEHDVFPEELSTFLGLSPRLRDVFIQHHGDLFEVEFWADLQARHATGEVIEILPYKESRRLTR